MISSISRISLRRLAPNNERKLSTAVQTPPLDSPGQLQGRPNVLVPTPSNQSEILPFFDWLEETLGIKTEFDWAKVPRDEIFRLGAGPIINGKYRGSLEDCLKSIYPYRRWPPWLFGNVPAGYWSHREHRREFFDYLAKEKLDIKTMDDWYNISKNQFSAAGGSSVLATAYKGLPLSEALLDIYPEHEWQFWRFATAPGRNWIRQQLPRLSQWLQLIETELEISKPEQWYQIARENLIPYGSKNILPAFDESLYELLRHVKSEISWKPWKFKIQPPIATIEKCPHLKWWLSADHATMKIFVSDVAEHAKLSRVNLNDWHRILASHVQRVGGSLVLERFQGSVRDLIRFSEPEYPWLDWLFEAEPPKEDFWKNPDARRAFLDWAFDKLGLDQTKGLDAWYGVSASSLRAIGGTNLLKLYNHSLDRVLQSVYTDHEWLPWKFPKCSNGFWENAANQKLYFEWLGRTLGYERPEDWYRISKSIVIANHGSSLLAHYFKNSPSLLVRRMMPDHPWVEWRFNMVGNGFWAAWDNRKAYFDWLAKELHLASMEDWYRVKKEDVISHNGAGLLVHRYANCVSLALADVFRDHEWQSWRWNRTPPLYWSTVSDDGTRVNMSALEFIQQAAENMSIKSLSDWYRISKPQLQHAGIMGIVSVYGGLPSLLKRLYPEHRWEASRFVSLNKRSQQRQLVNVLRQIFPNHDMQEETILIPKSLGASSTIQSVQIDVLFPSIHLAFEYQGEHHYLDVSATGMSDRKASVDLTKAAICMKEGITLIPVPYWWNGSKETLSNEIHAVRPDLVATTVGSGDGFPELPQSK
eukprot:TRINITY_DN13490_c0_g1_i1.p1 TRINITY_DN13490_c0_g1~~TRINITY_DN13490_c0_g1_i1.p1  ORF type:complete len:813 (-),score=56.65 TRINITY_DN13490_c0_g1_i1:127-2565(-)